MTEKKIEDITDPEREFYFALKALDTHDPNNLRWLANCAAALALELDLVGGHDNFLLEK